MATVTLYWKDGRREVATGVDFLNALKNSGHKVSGSELEFWSAGDADLATWDDSELKWKRPGGLRPFES